MLHIVNKSPFENSTLDSCLRVALNEPGAALLLIEDAVYAASKSGSFESAMKDALQSEGLCPVADIEARGMQDRVIEIKMVDYGGFGDLVAEHSNCQSWL